MIWNQNFKWESSGTPVRSYVSRDVGLIWLVPGTGAGPNYRPSTPGPRQGGHSGLVPSVVRGNAFENSSEGFRFGESDSEPLRAVSMEIGRKAVFPEYH